MKTFEVKPLGMVSGQYEQGIRTYKKVIGKENIWYLSTQDNSADNLYCTAINKTKRSNGFGGATLEFKLDDGTSDFVQGPWHSNSGSFLKDTGIDVTDKHFTFGVISMEKEWLSPNSIMKDVIYQDDDWTLGSFDRIENLAKEMARKLNKKVYFYRQSTGGSTQSWAEPKPEENAD